MLNNVYGLDEVLLIQEKSFLQTDLFKFASRTAAVVCLPNKVKIFCTLIVLPAPL